MNITRAYDFSFFCYCGTNMGVCCGHVVGEAVMKEGFTNMLVLWK